MRVLLTGAFGNVGLSALRELTENGHEVTVVDVDTPRNRRLAQKYSGRIDLCWADLRRIEQLEPAVQGQDVVVHMGGIIPPLADREPELAESVNIGGTRNVVELMTRQPGNPRLIFTSSIAVYGDRRESPLIRVTDPPNPNADDEYAKQKLECERIIKDSGLTWSIFRLSYIVSADKLEMDPIMFDVPLDTCFEICHTRDVGLAVANAIDSDIAWRKTLHIAGGEACRITYQDYLDKMMDIFGLGTGWLPSEAFSRKPFHCAYMTTDLSRQLGYQRHTLADYFDEVKKKVRVRRQAARLLRPILRRYILSKSEYLRQHKSSR